MTTPIIPGEQPIAPVPNVITVRRIHPLSIVFAAAGAVAMVIGMMSCVAAVATPTATPSPSVVTVYSPSPVAAKAAPAATTTAAPMATTKPAPPPSPTIDDGVWTVGVDIPPGKYRVTDSVSSDCYWEITKSGTNGNDIIANDIPGGGRPSVTLKAGQDFTTEECGTWRKV